MARGSYQKRVGKSGVTTWTCVIDVPPGVDGKRRQIRLKAATRKACEALVAKTLHQIETGSYIEPTVTTLSEYLDEWLPAIAATVRPATVARYRSVITHHLKPKLGSIRLAKLTPVHLQQFYTEQLATGLSTTTVAYQHMVMHRALDQAVKWNMIIANPCDRADAPRRRRPELSTWSAEHVRTFLAGTVNHPLAALFRLALLTGMRKGELLALRWSDVDLTKSTLSVRRSLTYASAGHWTIGEPKTAAGRRSIALPPSCTAALRWHRSQQAENRLKLNGPWQATDLVFERGNGELLHPNVARSQFLRLVKELGLPRIRFHDLRHTAATLALAEGVHPKIVQERLGHATISMTLDRYSHVSMDMQREAADRLDRALNA